MDEQAMRSAIDAFKASRAGAEPPAAVSAVAIAAEAEAGSEESEGEEE